MSTIQNFAKHGVWDYKSVIVPAAVTIPIAIEGAILAKNIFQKPHVIKEIFFSAKKHMLQSFTIQTGETKKQGIRRIAKNCFTVLGCLSLMGGAAYLSAILLPASFAVTAALSAIFMIGKLFLNGKRYKEELIAAFKPKKGESPEESKKRIRMNIIKTVVIAIVSATLLAIGAYFVIPMALHGFSWSLFQYLPFQTPAVVFAEYGAVGALHVGMACYKWKKGDKMGALFHLFAGALSFAFPAFYLHNDMRLHHSFFGLLMMAAPSRPVQFLGSAITLDSALYALAPLRGYSHINALGVKTFRLYDFINSILDNGPLFAGSYAGAMMLENVNKNWTQTAPK